MGSHLDGFPLDFASALAETSDHDRERVGLDPVAHVTGGADPAAVEPHLASPHRLDLALRQATRDDVGVWNVRAARESSAR